MRNLLLVDLIVGCTLTVLHTSRNSLELLSVVGTIGNKPIFDNFDLTEVDFLETGGSGSLFLRRL